MSTTTVPSCCRTGFRWSGTPNGSETRINDLDVYVAGDPDHQDAILFCHDGWGWRFNNNRLLVDHFAREVGVRVYMPDFYHGTAVPADQLAKGLENYDWDTWMRENDADRRMPEILAFVRHLRQQRHHTRLGAVGYCWGGRIAVRLGSPSPSPSPSSPTSPPAVDAISLAHPSFLTAAELRAVRAPTQILAAEEDGQFTAELQRVANEVLPTVGVAYEYGYFPGVRHGFATRCDERAEGERRALERAKNAVVRWFGEFLGGEGPGSEGGMGA